MTAQDLITFWEQGANEAWLTAQALIKSKRYLHALFFCHLALEKELKSKYVARHDEPAPPVHDLVWLLGKTEIKLDKIDIELLAEINKFNISGRYEDFKLDLYKQATSKYVVDWMEKTSVIREKIKAE